MDAIQNVRKIFFRRLMNQNMAAISSLSLMDIDLPWLKSRRLRALTLTKANVPSDDLTK